MRVDYFTEYSHSPAVGKAPETMDEASKVDLVEEDKKRSTVNIPSKKSLSKQKFSRRFSIECRKTKIKVVTTANQKKEHTIKT